MTTFVYFNYIKGNCKITNIMKYIAQNSLCENVLLKMTCLNNIKKKVKNSSLIEVVTTKFIIYRHQQNRPHVTYSVLFAALTF